MISIVVVNYESGSMLEELLRSMDRHPPSGPFETIVVDNGSTDGSERAAPRHGARLVRGTRNVGFGRAANRGAGLAAGRLLYFLNPDIILPDASLWRTADFLDRTPEAAIAGPALRSPTGTPSPSYGFFPHPASIAARRSGFARLLPRDALPRVGLAAGPGGPVAREVGYVSGAAMAIRAGTFRALAGFDPRYFAFYEETDLALRARRAGGRAFLVPEATVLHAGGGSFGRGAFYQRHFLASELKYMEKHHGRPSVLFYRMVSLGYFAARGARKAIRGEDPSAEMGALRGLSRRRHPTARG